MENAAPTNLPETLPISGNSKENISEEAPAEKSVARVSGSLPKLLNEDCSSTAGMQKFSSTLCPHFTSDTQVESTEQEVHYGSQTDKEKSCSISQTNQIQPLQERTGLVVEMGTKENQSVTLEYKPETAANAKLDGKEHTSGNIVHQPQSQISFTTSLVQQSGACFKDTAEHGAVEVCDGVENQSSHKTLAGAAEQTDSHQDSKPSLLPSPSSDNSEIKQADISKTQPKFQDTSNDARQTQKANSLESVEKIEHVTELVDTSNEETRPPSDGPKAGELLPALYTSPGEGSTVSTSTSGIEGGIIQRSCNSPDGEQLQSSTREEQPDMAIFSTSTEESSSKLSAAPTMYDTSLVVSLQAEQVVGADTSQSSDEVLTTETLMHSVHAQEIVVVGEDAHISGDWSNMQLNQSYLLQREDGSVCEAAIVNQLSTELSAGESVQADIELHSQPVEVYEFCSLVEEVAEETVCVSGGAQMPHSPEYEVNLFNALLEHPEDYTVKEELHLDPSIHTINEGETVIITQQPLPSSQDANQTQPCSNSNSHSLSLKNTRVAAVGQHLVLDATQAVQVANSSEVCLVEVATDTSGSFTINQGKTSLQIVTPCPQVSKPPHNETEVSETQTAPQKQQLEAAAGVLSLLSPIGRGEETGKESPVAVSVHVSHAQHQTPEVTIVSAAKSATTPSQSVQNARVSTETSPEALSTASQSSSNINPNLLLLKQGEFPPLKHPPSLLAQVSKQQNAAGKLANVHSSWPSSVSTECLPQTVPAADSLCTPGSQKDQTQCSVNQTSQSTSVMSFSSASKSVNEALINKTSTRNLDLVSKDVVAPTDVIPPTTPNTLNMLPLSAESSDIASPSPNDPVSQQDSLYVEEIEDMDQDEAMGDTEALEATSGQISSPEEASDEDLEKTESEMTTPVLSHKICQWIGDRVTASPSSSSLYPGPSPSSDWSTRRRERSSPLRGPHGKFVSPSSLCGYTSSSSPLEQNTPQRSRGERHTDMAELAKHEADIEHRTQALKRDGFWSMKRLTRLTEPQRPKVHWDYLCEEMQWLSADFAQERRWKRGVARKVVRMVMRHHDELRQKEEKAKRDEHAKIRRVASSIAKEVRAFWSSVEKVVQYKQQSRLEEKRKKALDLQLDFIVGQTEKYSDLLSKSLAPIRPPETVPLTPKKSLPPPVDEEDGDFEPPVEEEDDEETIEVEEQQEGNDAESHRREIELLKEEGLLPLDQLLSTLNLPQELGSEEECSDETSSSVGNDEEDGEFTANEEDAEDEEDTIAAQEKVEGNVNHAEELDDLAREGDMSVEELLEKYKGAYASDFEVPSASGSKASSDSEASGDEEVETEEDESDAESNTSSSESPGDSAEDDDSEKDMEESEEEEEDDDCGDDGMELLLKEGDNSPPSSSSRPKKEISHIAATAESLQPKGYTLATTKVKTPIPFLLHGTLREYQHIGLDWLVTMYEKKLNGILADEMGLGKTIQTIALLAHLACEKGNWGPHLIIVPTSVMLNWEMELKRWCPGFKILTYFGSQKERKLKRQGWTKPNAFHVCITSYKLVLQDHQAFRRKSWRYLILDEAQNIKNFKSQRWQSLLNFNSHRRLLLTGTPLQNSLMELWSLMHFLMPHVFQSHREFKEWFSNPLTGMIEGSQEYNEGLVKRLHKVLRPFLLRRIKVDVEKQMPKKFEHVVRCRLSKRQRFLYDDFMALASTRETLASGHFMSVINILMQLRKVCNHPNLFDPRPIQSPFITQPIVFRTASLVQDALEVSPFKRCDLSMFDLIGLEGQRSRYQADVFLPRHKVSRQLIQEIVESPEPPPRPKPVRMKVNRMFQPPPKSDNRPVLLMNKPACSVPPAAQTSKPPTVTELPSAQPPAPVVQQVVCSVTTTPPPRPPVHLAAQTAVRSSAPKPVLTVRPPTVAGTAGIPVHPSPNPSNSLPQRVLLSPDMQARLPSGEVVSIAQLASLAGRPVSSCQGSKPVTFQLQGNKLTLSGAPIHQVPAAPTRPVQSNVMHLVSSGAQHHLITSAAPVVVQSTTNTHAASTSTALPANRLPHNTTSQAVPSMVSSPGVVKIVVRQTAGKEGGPVPTLAVAPSPRIGPQASPSPHPHATTPVRNPAPLQITQRTPGPATAHYTIAPPGGPSSTPNQPHPPRPVLKVVQPPQSDTEQPAPAQMVSASSVSKALAATRDSSSSQTPANTKSIPTVGTKAYPSPRKVPPLPPRSPFYMTWLSDTLKDQRDSRLDLIFRVNERRCGAKPMYGQEVLDFLTFLPGPCPRPATLSSLREWGRSGHSSCLFSQWQNKYDFWFQSHAVKEAIHSIEERVDMLNDTIDRFTFVIPPVEAPPISMHCCHPPPSLSQKEVDFTSMLSTQVAPLTRCLHRIQCNMRTQFPDLRLIQYDCGKLQTLHTLLRKLKTGGHRVLIFTQMTRMLDVLEQFLNYHGHIYLRLDGSTRVEQRQALMERFNADRRIFCFILSTRSGGVGVNLTGADTVVFYDSDWNPTMDAQAQDRCHRIGQTRDVHIYRLISERTVEENILKKANQKRMLGDMAIEGGNFTTAFFKQQTIRELFDMNDGERKEVAVELSVPQAEEEEAVNKQCTTILEQALCRAEDEEDIVAASQAKAEQVAELAEFNENIPLDDGGEQEEVEELSKAEQEIAALVEQLTPIERYAMNFLEASLEDVCKEELKQAEEQVEAARKGLDQAKEEGLKLQASSDDEDDDFLSPPASMEPAQPTPARRGRKPKDKEKVVTSTRMSGRLRGASSETDPDSTTPREVPERLRFGLRERGAAKDTSAGSTTPSRSEQHKSSSSNRLHDSSKSSKAPSPVRDHQTSKTRTLPNRSHSSPVPSPPSTSPPGGKQQCAGEPDGKNSKSGREEKEGEIERRVSESAIESSCPVEHKAKDDDSKDHGAMSPPSTSSRSPRKRQSADGEVLRGLVEDSPSAKVLRKLPGRLVTVVEEKEPRRRRRRGSGTGGGASSEEAAVEENTAVLGEEQSKDSDSLSPDGKQKVTVMNCPLDQDSTTSQSVPPQPVRSYPPYSPPHLSPDMPVLRNLPVRRRLETESRMAAQLGEQLLPGRGRGANQSRKTDTALGKDAISTTSESSANSLVPVKRKRGRPPKTPPRLPESDTTVTPPSQPILASEEGNPPLSPKRKRGRPRKDSANIPETISDGQNSKHETPTTGLPSTSKPEVSKELTVPSATHPDAFITTSKNSQSTKAEGTDCKTEVSASAPNPALICTTAYEPSTTASAPLQEPTAPQMLTTSSGVAATVQSQAPSVSFISVTATPVMGLCTTTSSPPSRTVASPPSVKPTPAVSSPSKAPVDPKPAVSTNVKTTKPNSVETTPAANTPSLVLSSPLPVKVVSTSVTTSSNASSKIVTPEVTTAAESAPASEKDTQHVSASSSPTSAPTDTAKVPEKATNQPSASPKPISTPTTTATTAKASQSKENSDTIPGAGTVVSHTSAAVSLSDDKYVPSSSAEAKPNVATTKAPTKAMSTQVAPPVATVTVASTPCTSGMSICTSTTTTTSASVTITNKTDEVPICTSPATEESPAPSLEHITSTTPSTTAEMTAKTPPPVSTCAATATSALPAVNTSSSSSSGTSICVSSKYDATSTQVSTTKAPVSEDTTTAPTVSPVSTTQTSAIPALQVQCSASSGVSPASPTEAQCHIQTPEPSNVLPEKQSSEPMQEVSEMEMKIGMDVEDGEAEGTTSDEKDPCKPHPKRRRVESSSETKEPGLEVTGGEAESSAVPQEEEIKQEQTTDDQKRPIQKRPLSRQSSQESTRSSSPSSGCSTSTLTRHAHHKRTYENRLPTKKRRMDVTAEAGEEKTNEGGKRMEEGAKEHSTASSRERRSRSSSSSSDSDNGESRKERRLTRSAKHRQQVPEGDKGNNRQGKKQLCSSDRKVSNNGNTSTGGESGSDTSSVRTTRKSTGSSQDSKPTNSTPSLPPEPLILGKRCSALNAAAKLLAMKGRVDTPGHTPRKEPGAKAAGTSPASSSDKGKTPKSKSIPSSPQTLTANLTNNKSSGSKLSTANQTSRSASRSTRQCPGSLVPPLEGEYKRTRAEDKERGNRKSAGGREGEAEAQSSSRGHSACSSMSSDGEGEGGGRSSRSRSSSNSSQRTHSISSQNTEHRESRAASSGSERSSERAKSQNKKEKKGPTRESRRESRRSRKLSQEVTSSSGTEATPDRVLRSVAALAAVQARSPAASTRSSSSQQRHNKT